MTSSVLQYLHRPADKMTSLKKSVVKSFCTEQIERLQLVPVIQGSNCQPQDTPILSSYPDSDQDVYDKLQMAINQAETHTHGEKHISTASVISSELSTAQCTGYLGNLTKAMHMCLQTIPPTSVEAERVFSAAGFFCNRFRTRLSNRSLSALSFLRTNLRNDNLKSL